MSNPPGILTLARGQGSSGCSVWCLFQGELLRQHEAGIFSCQALKFSRLGPALALPGQGALWPGWFGISQSPAGPSGGISQPRGPAAAGPRGKLLWFLVGREGGRRREPSTSCQGRDVAGSRSGTSPHLAPAVGTQHQPGVGRSSSTRFRRVAGASRSAVADAASLDSNGLRRLCQRPRSSRGGSAVWVENPFDLLGCRRGSRSPW